MKQFIHTTEAPSAAGSYSQAIKAGNVVYFAGQIPLDPKTQELVTGGIEAEMEQVFKNIKAVAEAAGGSLDHIVRLGVYLIDLSHFAVLNSVMQKYFKEPYPARTTIGVSALPKGSAVEVDAVMCL